MSDHIIENYGLWVSPNEDLLALSAAGRVEPGLADNNSATFCVATAVPALWLDVVHSARR